MSQPRFLADHDLRRNIVRAALRIEPSLQIATADTLGLSSVTDDEVLEFAWKAQWLVVSHDVNTMKAVAEQRIADGEGIHGLFLVPQSRPTTPVADCLVLVSQASEFEEWRDQIVFLPF